MEIGLAYGIRLKTKRLEFYPEILASRQKSYDISDPNDPDFAFKLTRTTIGVQINFQIYSLDFTNVCKFSNIFIR